MKRNALKQKLAAGETCIGTFITIPSPTVVEIAAVAGFDFLIIDLEHGNIDLQDVENMVRACDLHSVSCIVRLPENYQSFFPKILETGAQGVQVPHVQSGREAEEIVKAVKYWPEGMRGVSPYTRAGDYSSIQPTEHFKISNQETMVVVQIENLHGVDNMEQIASVKAVDVIFAGPYDLSQAFGIPGKLDDERVVNTVERLANVCRRKGRWAGTFVSNHQNFDRWRSVGIQYIAFSVDCGIIYKAFKEITGAAKPQ